MTGGKTLGSATFVAAALSAFPASAAIVCVNPAGGLCQTTIQAGVNAAAPGDTVQVAAGTYYENVVVPLGKDGLQIVGAGKLLTTIDADDPNGGYAVFVYPNGVQVRNLGIRNVRQTAISLNGNGAVVSGVRIVGVRGPGNHGIVASGSTGHQILQNEIRSISGGGILLISGSHDALVQGNVVSQASYAGIQVTGANAQVLGNRVSGTVSFGVLVLGPSGRIESNQIEGAGGTGAPGLQVEGDNPVVRGNRLTRARNVRFVCATCTTAIVEGNTVSGSPVEGMYVQADSPGLALRSNTVTKAQRSGFWVTGTGILATLNRATDSGIYQEGDCFRIQNGAGNHVFTGNVATRCAASGFFVSVAGVTLDGNVSTGAGVDGFTIYWGANSVLTGNSASSSNGAGYAVAASASGTALTGNQGSKNRYDFCDDGILTDTSGGNAFGSTSSVCEIFQ